jgi:serine/threonine-protein kinase
MIALVRLEDGSLGMRMELAHGVALEELLEREASRRSETPDVRFAVTIVRKLLGQLRRLHEMTEEGSPLGFIPSDIKPANVFVDARDRVDPHVTLLDFGVAIAGQLMARDLASTVGRRTTFLLDQSGGTIGYAPPHHFTSKPTPLSDVFAAIVILYELLTVEWPWDAGGMRKSPVNLFKFEALMTQPPRPLRSVRASITESDASVLDRFFRDAFSTLVGLADEVADALGTGDQPAIDRLVPTLRSLAGRFQSELDAVASSLSDEAERLSRAPTSPPPRPSPESTELVPAVSSALLEDDEPGDPERSTARRAGPRGVVVLAAIALSALGGAAVGAQWRGEQQRSIGASAVGRASVTEADVRPFAAPSQHEAGVERQSLDAGATPSSAPSRCECFAPASSVRVLASTSSVRDVELCVTREPRVVEGDGGAAQFEGRGTIAAVVRDALPRLRCEDEEHKQLELSVEALGEGAEKQFVFRCQYSMVQLRLIDAGAGIDASARIERSSIDAPGSARSSPSATASATATRPAAVRPASTTRATTRPGTTRPGTTRPTTRNGRTATTQSERARSRVPNARR